MKLTILGMNGPWPAPPGATSGYLVTTQGAQLALDMGSGVLSRLTERTAPEELTALLLSHWHFDHCSDVLPLLYRLESHAAAGGAPLHIWAPVDDASPVRKAVQGCRAAVLHDVHPGDVLTLGDAEVTVHDARHPVPAVMYRITGDGRTLCYTGDTNTAAGLEAFAEGADLLLADGLFPTAAWSEGKPHLSAALAAQLARDAHVRRLVITHLNPAIDPEGLLKEARSIRQDAELAVTGACLTL